MMGFRIKSKKESAKEANFEFKQDVKEFRKSYILISALYVVLGVVLAAWPTASVRMICYALGLVMIVLGLTHGIIYFTKDNLNNFLQMDLVIGIICLAFGLFVLLNPTFLASVLPFAMGIILLLGSVVKLQSAFNMRRLGFRRWYIVLVIALIIVALGIVLLCNPFAEEHYMILYIGICLILDGISNLGSLISILIRVKKLVRVQRENPEANLRELLAQVKTESGDIVQVESAPKGNRQE